MIFRDSNTVESFIKCKSHKVLLTDPQDVIVKDSASLKTGISKSALLSMPKLCTSVNKKYISILDEMLNKKEKNDFINNLMYIISLIDQLDNNKRDSNNIKEIEKKLIPERNNLLTNKKNIKNIKYLEFKKSQNNLEFDFDTFETEECSTAIKKFLKQLALIFSRFESCGDTLITLKKYKNNLKGSSKFIDVNKIYNQRTSIQTCLYGDALKLKICILKTIKFYHIKK
jgi:hypothetical protein